MNRKSGKSLKGEKARIGPTPHDSSIGWIQRIRIQGNSRHQTSIRVRLSISGIPLWQEVWAYVVQGDIVEWLMWMEERAHHGCTELGYGTYRPSWLLAQPSWLHLAPGRSANADPEAQ